MQSSKASGSLTSIQEEEIVNWTPSILPSNQQILIFSFCSKSACLISKPMYECFLPKSNLRPVLGSERSLQRSRELRNKVTVALFLMKNQIKHPVYMYNSICYGNSNIFTCHLCLRVTLQNPTSSSFRWGGIRKNIWSRGDTLSVKVDLNLCS